MKKLNFLLLFLPLISFGQYFDVEDFKNLIDLRSVESLMYTKGLRNIEVEKQFQYLEHTKCNCSVFSSTKNRNDDCDWCCLAVGEIITKGYELQKVPFTNYEIRHKQISKFANNYNSEKKSATLFVNTNYVRENKNTNCKNEFYGDWKKTIYIDFQLNDKDEGEYLKKSIVENAEYIKTIQIGESIYVKYVYQDKKRERSIYFDIVEYDNYIFLDIKILDYDLWSVMKYNQ